MSSTTPLASICCITYNHENFIRQAIDSFLEQNTNFPIEIIIHDDASTDSTANVLREYQEKHPHLIKIILRTDNQYSLRGFEFISDIFKQARGKYIALCEGDDYWTDPLKLQKQIDLMESDPECVLSFHRCLFRIENEGEITLNQQEKEAIVYDYNIENLLTKWGIPTASMVFRNIILELPDWFSKVASGDIAIAMILFDRGTFKCLEEDVMSVYRITGNGESRHHNGTRMIHYRAYLYAKLNEYFNFKYEEEIYQALFNVMKTYGGYKFFGKDKNNMDNCTTLDLSKLLAIKVKAKMNRLLS
jgi:glycosyltransferase involved in cell wall biosynthesis